MKLKLKFIFDESCLFIASDIFMFLYENNIVFAYKSNRERVVQNYIDQIKSILSKSTVDKMIFNYLMIRLIKKINLRKIKNENETFNIHCDH